MARIDTDNINYNAVRIIDGLTENIYSTINDDESGKLLMAMTLGEISGVIEMAKTMKETLKA